MVKLALLKASQMQMYRPLMYNCHGVSFFGKTLSPKVIQRWQQHPYAKF